MSGIEEVDVRVRAALALDLLVKMDMAITTLDLRTVREVQAMIRGMTEAARDVVKNGMPENPDG